jgi:hypothetical protein
MRTSILMLLVLGCAVKDGDSSGVGDDSITNKVPTAPEISLVPEEPYTRADLSVLIDKPASDSDGDALSYRYTWAQDDAARLDLKTATVESVYTRRGEVWTVTVVAHDGVSSGPEVVESVEIRNSLPALTSLVVSPSEVDELSEVECTPGDTIDQDHDPVGVMTRWVVSGVELEIEGPLTGEFFDRGDEIFCRAYLDDGVDTTTQDSRVLVVNNALPWVVGVTLSHDNPSPSDVLEAVPEGWWDDDGDPEGYLYAWFVNWDLASEEATIDSTVFSPGDNIFVELTAYDGLGVGNTVASHYATAVE